MMGCNQSEIAPQNETPRKGCTDVIWLIIYIIFWILMIVVAVFSFIHGNPKRITNGFDSFGNTCGEGNNKKLINSDYSGVNTADKSFLFFLDAEHLIKSLKICVKKCPDRNIESFGDLKNFYKDTGSNLCRYDINLNIENGSKDLFGQLGPCLILPFYETRPLLNRCIPKSKHFGPKFLKELYNLFNNWDTLQQSFSDLYSSWKEMIICLFVAFICSLVMVSILHYMVTVVSWIFMIIVSIVSVAGTALLWYTYNELKNNDLQIPDSPFISESLKNETAFKWYSIIATIITVILLLLVIVMRSRVSFLAALFKETAHCLGSIPALFFQPLITFFFLVIFFVFWAAVVVCLATAGVPSVASQTSNAVSSTPGPGWTGAPAATNETAFKSVEFDPIWVKSMWWMCLICLVWGGEFILGCQQMVIAGAVSHWYFRGPNAHSSPVLYSIGKLLKYHLGSVAKGSLLITLFKIPRLILSYLHAKLSARADKGSDCAKCGLKCCICCFYCFEKFIRYLNHNAYTIITIERCHFCKAAAKAFGTIVNNALQVATINSVGDFILFLGKCIVTAVTGIVGLLLLKRNDNLHFYAVPTLVICIYSFFVAHCILSLYEMVVDALFICVCEDRNMNADDGKWKNSRLAELGDKPRHKNETEQDEEL